MQINQKPTRLVAMTEALVVNLVWASTFVFVKKGLENNLTPLNLAGLRYFGGFLLLLPLLAVSRGRTRRVSRGLWLRLFLIGVFSYLIGNGALFWGLQYIPATTGSFLLSLTPLPVLFLGIFWLKELPTRVQLAGVLTALAGSLLFFSPGLSAGDPAGIAVVTVGLIGFALFGILGREVARKRQVDTLSLTALPLAFGGGLLLVLALPLEGLPQTNGFGWFIVLWLAVVNTAGAYILYNHSLTVLTALEMNALMNLAPLVTAALAWVFLGEQLDWIQVAGMAIMIIGLFLIEWRTERAALPEPVVPAE